MRQNYFYGKTVERTQRNYCNNEKTNIFYSPSPWNAHLRYQRVRNIRFPENIVYLQNGWYLNIFSKIISSIFAYILLTLSWWRRSLWYRNQSIDLQSKSMDWFLFDNGLRHERVKIYWMMHQLLENSTLLVNECEGNNNYVDHSYADTFLGI